KRGRFEYLPSFPFGKSLRPPLRSRSAGVARQRLAHCSGRSSLAPREAAINAYRLSLKVGADAHANRARGWTLPGVRSRVTDEDWTALVLEVIPDQRDLIASETHADGGIQQAIRIRIQPARLQAIAVMTEAHIAEALHQRSEVSAVPHIEAIVLLDGVNEPRAGTEQRQGRLNSRGNTIELRIVQITDHADIQTFDRRVPANLEIDTFGRRIAEVREAVDPIRSEERRVG